MSIRKNTLWNLAGNGLPLVAGAIAIPFLMQRLGTERFGIVTIIWTIIGYLSLFDFGLGRALTHITAHNIGSGATDDNLKILKTGAYITIVAGFAGAVVFALLAYGMAFRWLNVTVQYQWDTFYALLITAAAVPFTTVSAAFRGTLEGHEKFKEVNIIKFLFGTATFIFPVIALLVTEATVANVAVSLVIARAITFWIYLRKIHEVESDYRLTLKPHKVFGKKLITFGSWMTISNIVSPILVSADRFIIAGTLGAAVVAYYTVPFEIVVRLLIIPGAIGSTIFPRLSSLFTADQKGADKLVKKSVLVIAAVMLILSASLMLLYKPVVTLWISKDFAEQSFESALLLSIGAIFNGIAYIYYTAVQAKDGSKFTGILHLTELLFYVPVLLFVVSKFGIRGAAFAWLLRMICDFILLRFCYIRGRHSAV